MAHVLSSASVSVALIGPNTLFREGMKRVLDDTRYQTSEIAEAPDQIEPRATIELFIFAMCSDFNRLLARIQHLKEHHPSARVVVINDTAHAETVWALLGAGADGYFCSNSSPQAALASLDVVMLGGTVVPPFQKTTQPATSPTDSDARAEAPLLEIDPHYKKLSDRETKILLCLMKGDSNKQIARKFDIAEATVKVHLKAILRKIRVSNRTQAAVWAHNNKIGISIAGHGAPDSDQLHGTSQELSGIGIRTPSPLHTLQEGILLAAEGDAAALVPRRIVRGAI